MRRKKVQDKELAELAQAIDRLMDLALNQVTALNEAYSDLRVRMAILEAESDSALIAEAAEANDVVIAPARSYEEVEPNVFRDTTYDDESGEPNLPAPPVESGNFPYELSSVDNLYVSGEDPYAVAFDLLSAAQDRLDEPTNLMLSVQWEAGDPTAKLPEDQASYFAGHVAVSV